MSSHGYGESGYGYGGYGGVPSTFDPGIIDVLPGQVVKIGAVSGVTGIVLKVGTFKIGQRSSGPLTPYAPLTVTGFTSATPDILI